MKARDKEQYLREYQILKSQGKPFFPYAVLKDSAMAVIVLAVIIAMAVILGAGELSNKADPTTTTYTPRPEWYFFFLFELLRVIKPPDLVILATIGIPTIAWSCSRCCRSTTATPSAARSGGRSRPPPRSRDRGDGISDLPRRARGGAGQDPHEGAGRGARRARTSPTSRAAAPATSSARRATPAPGRTSATSARSFPRAAIERTLINPTAPMPSYADLPPKKFDALVEYLSALR